MLSYETAVKLKKAGFEQYPNNWQGDHMDDSSGLGTEAVYIPTLSELVNACEPWIDGVTRFSRLGKHWVAHSSKYDKTDKGTFEVSGHGETWEEAVAELYLAINKK